MMIGKFGRSSYLFDPDYFTDKIYIYKPDALRPRAVIPTDAKGINGIALRAASALWASGASTVRPFGSKWSFTLKADLLSRLFAGPCRVLATSRDESSALQE